MCKETYGASPSTKPSVTLMFYEYRYPSYIARHAHVSPFTAHHILFR